MIFAREVSGPLTSLVKKIDEATAKNSKAKMGSFIVFLSDEEKFDTKLKELADKEGLKNIIVTVMSTASGPPDYSVSKDASVTVVLYNKRKVEANYAFEKGKLTDKDVEKIVGDLSKILPKDK